MENKKKEVKKEELTEEQLDNTSGGQKITADIYVGGGKYKTMTFEAQVQEMKMPLFLSNTANSAAKTCLNPSCKKSFTPTKPDQVYCSDCLNKYIKIPNAK